MVSKLQWGWSGKPTVFVDVERVENEEGVAVVELGAADAPTDTSANSFCLFARKDRLGDRPVLCCYYSSHSHWCVVMSVVGETD